MGNAESSSSKCWQKDISIKKEYANKAMYAKCANVFVYGIWTTSYTTALQTLCVY